MNYTYDERTMRNVWPISDRPADAEQFGPQITTDPADNDSLIHVNGWPWSMTTQAAELLITTLTEVVAFKRGNVEQWRAILGFEDSYQVSNRGNVRSIDRVITASNGSKRTRKGKPLRAWGQGPDRKVLLSRGGEATTHTTDDLTREAWGE